MMYHSLVQGEQYNKEELQNTAQFLQHGDDTAKILTRQQLIKSAPYSRSPGVGTFQCTY
jgi:hypothetical protein